MRAGVHVFRLLDSHRYVIHGDVIRYAAHDQRAVNGRRCVLSYVDSLILVRNKLDFTRADHDVDNALKFWTFSPDFRYRCIEHGFT